MLSLIIAIALGSVSIIGLIAIINPRLFQNIATTTSTWIDTNYLYDIFDRRYNIDDHVLRHSRTLGFTVLLATSILAYRLIAH